MDLRVEMDLFYLNPPRRWCWWRTKSQSNLNRNHKEVVISVLLIGPNSVRYNSVKFWCLKVVLPDPIFCSVPETSFWVTNHHKWASVHTYIPHCSCCWMVNQRYASSPSCFFFLYTIHFNLLLLLMQNELA